MRKLTRFLLLGGVLLLSLAFVGCGNVNLPGNGSNPQQTAPPSPGNSGHGTTSSKQPPGKNSTGSGNSRTVTIHVGGAASPTLVSVAVSVNGMGTTFVPVSQSVASVLLPSGWRLQSISFASAGTMMKWINPKDPTQFVSEVVKPTARNLSEFYANQSGSASWLVPNQVVEFRFVNPNNPNPDMGIIANNSSGSSIRLDVYLPDNEKATAKKIIDSFVGIQ